MPDYAATAHQPPQPPRSQRSDRSVPRWLRAALLAALALQILWQSQQPAPHARAADLPTVPPLALLRLASLGEPEALAKVSMLYVQSHDEQAGISLAFRTLDYGRLRDWLATILTLDPGAQYPLLAASEVYGAVSDPQRARMMLDLVYQRYREDPARRWPWLAHAALVARHQLNDMALARRYAHELRTQAQSGNAPLPHWARELEIFITADMGEADSARTLIGALISSGQISDPHELAFLAHRLEQLAPAQH